MTTEIDPKIIKIEPEEETKVHLFLNTQRYLVVNNDIKEEISYDSCNTKCDNQFESVVGDQEQDNNSSCVNLTDTKCEQNLNTKLLTNTTLNHDPFSSKQLQPYCREDTYNIKYKCDHCEYTTQWVNNLQVHSAEHTSMIYKCDFSSKWINGLRQHSAGHEGVTYKCNKCDFTTKWISSLKVHEGSIYKCEHCNFSAHLKRNLRLHSAKHTEKIYKCDQCDYITKWRSNLKEHSAKHKGITYKCDHCNFFTHLSSLVRHSDQHKGVMYKCDKCHFRTTHKRSCTSHCAKHLNGNVIIIPHF